MVSNAGAAKRLCVNEKEDADRSRIRNEVCLVAQTTSLIENGRNVEIFDKLSIKVLKFDTNVMLLQRQERFPSCCRGDMMI